MTSVDVRKNEQGDYELGATVDGVWVVYAVKGAGYVEMLKAQQPVAPVAPRASRQRGKVVASDA